MRDSKQREYLADCLRSLAYEIEENSFYLSYDESRDVELQGEKKITIKNRTYNFNVAANFGEAELEIRTKRPSKPDFMPKIDEYLEQ